jgi:hypothetical protein
VFPKYVSFARGRIKKPCDVKLVQGNLIKSALVPLSLYVGQSRMDYLDDILGTKTGRKLQEEVSLLSQAPVRTGGGGSGLYLEQDSEETHWSLLYPILSLLCSTSQFNVIHRV